MWMIWAILGVSLPALALGLYGLWNERQNEKYNEWVKQQEELNKPHPA